MVPLGIDIFMDFSFFELSDLSDLSMDICPGIWYNNGTINNLRLHLREVIRRNCDVDSRIIDSLVDKLGSCGDKDHKKCEYQLRLENYDLGGIARDFELLKKAGIIEHVTKPTNYIIL